MTPPRFALLLLLSTVACGDAPASLPEPLGEARQPAGAPLSCTLPEVPVSHGPSTSEAWDLVQLQASVYPGAVCNDGTSATYMIRRNPHSTKWLIWLKGGGSCGDSATCASRWQNAGEDRMSSARLMRQDANGTVPFPQQGVFSVSPTDNPTFHDANLVHIPYCSSDIWSGNRAGNASQPVSSVARWHFRGRAILQAVIKELWLHEGLQGATNVVYGGGSAGGLGVYATIDEVGAVMPSGARFMGLPDSGFRFDHPSYDATTGLESTAVPTASRAELRTSASNWRGMGDASCDAAATTADERVDCREPEYLVSHGHVRTPLLIISNQYDQSPLWRLGVELDANGMARNDAERGYISRFTEALRAKITGTDALHSFFSDYTGNHTTAESDATGVLAINGVTLRDAIDAFYRRPCVPQRRLEDPIPGVP